MKYRLPQCHIKRYTIIVTNILITHDRTYIEAYNVNIVSKINRTLKPNHLFGFWLSNATRLNSTCLNTEKIFDKRLNFINLYYTERYNMNV